VECAACVKTWTAKKENQKLGPEREGEGGGKEVEKKIEGAPSPHSQKLPRTVGAPLPSLSLPSLHTTSSFSRFVSRTVSMARSSAGLSSLLENNRCERKERERERRIGAKWGDSLDAPLLSRKPRPLKTSQKQKTNFQLSLQPLVRAHEGRRPELLRQAQEPAGAQVPVDRLRRQPRAGEERVVVAFFSFPFRQLPSGLSNFVVGGIFRLAQRLFFSFVSLPHASFALRFSLRLSRNSKKRNRPTKSSASTPGRSLSR